MEGGSARGRKKLFDPVSVFRIPVPPCALKSVEARGTLATRDSALTKIGGLSTGAKNDASLTRPGWNFEPATEKTHGGLPYQPIRGPEASQR
jgi:hypothetical protein